MNKFKEWLRNKLWEFLEIDEILAELRRDCENYTDTTIWNQDFVTHDDLSTLASDIENRINDLE